jgi:hypothetical protein
MVIFTYCQTPATNTGLLKRVCCSPCNMLMERVVSSTANVVDTPVKKNIMRIKKTIISFLVCFPTLLSPGVNLDC